jgi:hypothetical protein
MHVRTCAGDVGVYFEPAGGGYEDLLQHAVDFDVYGVRVRVAALSDIIKSKQTANRLKDQAALPHLYALEDEIAAIERERRG